MRGLLYVILGVGSVGCFRPEIGEVVCSEQRECPPSMVCGVDNVCRAPGEPAGADAGESIDATRLDESTTFAVSHLEDGITDFGSLDLVISGQVEIDTSALLLGAPFNRNLESVAQIGGGPQTALLVVSSLEIKPGATLRVRGARALIIASADGFTIAGTIDGNAEDDRDGPGATSDGRGIAGATDDTFHSGGGGGAHASFGGQGGETEGVTGGAGGEIVGDASMSVLAGGSSGGSAALGSACQRRGGGGGGAIQLSTPAEIEITPTGMLTSNGGGGEGGGACPGGRGGPGAGGGSGGAIFLQASRVAIDGVLIAHGGGGGGGGGDDPGEDGARGQAGGLLGGGGGGGGDDSGDGGSGGDDAASPGDGGPSRTSNGGGGGGGGAAGRIALRGEVDIDQAAVVSPAATTIEER